MFYALTQGLLDVAGLEIQHVLQDIETLNQAAFEGDLRDHGPLVPRLRPSADRYQLMPSGASFGDGYGPIVVAREPFGRADLPGLKVAIPGELTTAHLALRLWQPRGERRRSSPSTRSSTPSGPARWSRRGHPRGAAHLRRPGAAQGRGPGRLVEGGDRPPAAARGQRHPPRPRRGPQAPPLPAAHREHRLRARPPRRRRWAMPRAMPAGSRTTPSARTASSACTSTTGPATTARPGARAVQLLLDRGHEAGILPQRIEAEFIEG